MDPMTNDAMTKADAARERVLDAVHAFVAGMLVGRDRSPEAIEPTKMRAEMIAALTAYGDARAVEAEIAAMKKWGGCRSYPPCQNDPAQWTEEFSRLWPGRPCAWHVALADAEQREKALR